MVSTIKIRKRKKKLWIETSFETFFGGRKGKSGVEMLQIVERGKESCY